MGDVLTAATKAISTVKAATGNQGSGQVATSPLALSQGQPGGATLPPTNISVGTPDQSQGSGVPSGLQMLMGAPGASSDTNSVLYPNTTNPSAPNTPTDVTQTPNNPYTPYDNNSPSSPPTASDQGSSSPSTPGGSSASPDSWTPQHHEGTLAKIADFMLMMKGRNPVFRDRVNNANLSDAMQPYRQSPTDANLELVAQRMTKLPDMAEKGIGLHNQIEQDQFYSGTAAERKMIAQQQGMNVVGGIMNAVQNSSDPASVYSKNLPLIQKQAEAYSLPPPPPTYDTDAVAGYIGGALKPADQQRLNIEQARLDQQTKYQNAQLGIDASKLKLSTIDTAIHAQNAGTQADTAQTNKTNVSNEVFHRNLQSLETTMKGSPAAKVPWLMNSLAAEGKSPQPNHVYVSGDGTAGMVYQKGNWFAIDMTKSDPKKNKWSVVKNLSASQQPSGDFSQ